MLIDHSLRLDSNWLIVSSNGCNGLLPGPSMGIKAVCLKLMLFWWFPCKAWPEYDELWQFVFVYLWGDGNWSRSVALCCRFSSSACCYSLGLSPWLFNISVLWSWYAWTCLGLSPRRSERSRPCVIPSVMSETSCSCLLTISYWLCLD